MRSAGLALVALSAVATVSGAQEHVHPGASREKLGTVHFATSCSVATRDQFDRAVALLHSFEFAGSIAGFRSVLAVDSSCAMAHWGIALSQWSNPMAAGNRSPEQLMRGRIAADSAVQKSARATKRERLYAAAVEKPYKNYETINQQAHVEKNKKTMSDLV